jgi:chromate transporter
MFHEEVVVRRKWIDEQHFLDLLGATNLIPGPNSTEMSIHIGFVRAGWPGLILAGACFITPAMLIVIAFAWAYQQVGETPAASSLLYGVKPVMIAIILKALWELGRKAIKGKLTGFTVAAVLALALLGLNELALLLAGGLLVMGWANFRRIRAERSTLPALLAPLGLGALSVLLAQPFSLSVLFLTFLKIGSVLYGSGYVLLAFLRADFVVHLGWLTDRQLLDAIAIGQVTPGPVFTTATFIGYLLAGIPGALLATLGIFLPAFVFVAVTSPYISRLRSSPWLGALLDGVNAASLGLMGSVTLQLGMASLVDLPAIIIGVVAAYLILRTRLNPTWIILGGALVWLIRHWV